MKNTVQTWVIGTLLFVAVQLCITFALFGFPPTPYTTFFLGGANEATGDLWQPLAHEVPRYIDLLFAPFAGIIYVFYRQGFFKPGEGGGYVVFGIIAYVLIAVFKQHHYTYWFLLLVACAVAWCVKPPDSLKIVYTTCIAIGWFNWGAQENGIGLIPWIGYSVLIIFPTLVALVVHLVFKNFNIRLNKTN